MGDQPFCRALSEGAVTAPYLRMRSERRFGMGSMTFFRDTRLMVKSAIPQIMLAILAAGLVIYARGTLANLAEEIRIITDVNAVRLENILRLNVETNEASIVVRNMAIAKNGEKLESYKVRYHAAMAASRAALDELNRIADSEERRAANGELASNLTQLTTLLNKAVELRSANDPDGAVKIIVVDASEVRAKLRDQIKSRTAVLKKQFELERASAGQLEKQADSC